MSNINELKKKLFDKLYSKFNKPQREAIYTVNGHLLVLAGAGTGKTTVLVNRIAHIIRYGNAMGDGVDHSTPPIAPVALAELEAAESNGVEGNDLRPLLDIFAVEPCRPWQILAITFTNKAAGEIKTRLSRLLGEEVASEIWAGTFHSVCVRILRRHGQSIGIPHNFTIYDSEDTKKLISKVTKDLELDEKMYAAKSVAGYISSAKEKLQTPADFLASSNARDPRVAGIAKIFETYEKRLREAAALDFDDLIVRTIELFKKDSAALEHYVSRFKYVCVDEYQDTNKSQHVLTEMLSGSGNLMAVGDDDQSIYRFRGATIENILGFEKSFDGAKIIKLEQNYRSTTNILSAANALIANNKGRHGKNLWCEAGDGDKILIKGVENQAEEAAYICRTISEAVIRGASYRNFAILYRQNAVSGGLEPAFHRANIPYRILGGTRFFDRKEVKDVMSYLSLINNPADNLRLRRVINEPKRKIGETTLTAVEAIAIAEGKSLFDVIVAADAYIPLAQSADRLLKFAAIMNEFIVASKELPISELMLLVMNKSGYLQSLRDSRDDESDRIENLSQLVAHAKNFEREKSSATLENYLEDAALMSEADNYDRDADTVVMMTVHAAKGMEFDTVFIASMENGIFPSSQSQYDPPEREEERRLAYVAITRAKRRLIITHARERSIFTHTQYFPPSDFIAEIPIEYRLDEALPRPESRKKIEVKETEYQKFLREKSDREKQAEKSAVTPTVASCDEFAAGERVTHALFGAGTILSAAAMGPDTMYEIAFDNAGTKKLMGKYAKLKKG